MNPQQALQAPVDYSAPDNVHRLRRADRNTWERYLRELDPSALAPDGTRAAEAGGRTKGVALLLATYGRPDGTRIYPGVRNVASAIGLGDRQTREHLARLRRAGLLRRVAKGSNLGIRNAADRYELTLPPAGDTTGSRPPEQPSDHGQGSARTTGIPRPTNTAENTGNHPPTPTLAPSGITADNTQRRLPKSVAVTWERLGIPELERQALWRSVCSDPETRNPTARALKLEWISDARRVLAGHQKAERHRQRTLLERTEPECHHGVAAGRAPAPHDGAPLCSTCRSEGVVPVLQCGVDGPGTTAQ